LHHLTSLITPNNQANAPSSLNLHYFNLIITLVNNGQLGHFFQIQITPRYGTIDNSPLNTPPLQPICQSILEGINQLEPGEIPNHDEHFMNLLLNSNTIDDHSHHLDLIHLNEETNLVDEESVVPLPLIPLLLTWLNELFEFHPMEVLLITHIYSSLLNLLPISMLEQLLGYGLEGDYGKFPPNLFPCYSTLKNISKKDEVRWTICIEFLKEVLVGLVIRSHCFKVDMKQYSDSSDDSGFLSI
jgi:hypothetical protein